jgi:hypothetical protein
MSDKESPDYDMSIHSNPSALAWTKFFRECCPDCNLDDDTMHGWFANAMMAMHDHIYQTQPKREPLSDEEIDKGYEESDGNYYELAFRDGVRFAEKHYGIGE